MANCIDNSNDMALFAVTELTNHDSAFDEQNALEIAKMAKELGYYGVQAPGTKLDRVRSIRKMIGNKMSMACCGIGAQGGIIGSAISAGADFEIVGRAIYDNKNPHDAAKRNSTITSQSKSIKETNLSTT